LSDDVIDAKAPFPAWQYVHGCAPDHTGLRYALLPPTGFAFEWHHTVLHVPALHVIAPFTESVPATPTLSAYTPGVTEPPVYGLLQRFAPKNVFGLPVLYVWLLPLSENTTSAYAPVVASLSPLVWTTFPRVERFAWHTSHAFRYPEVLPARPLSVCVRCTPENVNPFPAPMSWWQTAQPETVSVLSQSGSGVGVPWHDVPEHVFWEAMYVPPTDPTKSTFFAPFT
jgi:hypothetical protein